MPTGITSPDDPVIVAKRILTEVDQPVLIGAQELYARASMSIAVAEPGNAVADELLHHADIAIAMYDAKRRQSHTFQLYVDGIRDPAVNAVALDEELRQVVGTANCAGTTSRSWSSTAATSSGLRR